MPIAQSKVTSQGQISVPLDVRRKLGIGPGSVLEWNEEDGKIFVKRATRYTTEDVHRVAFPDGPPARRTLAELKDGIRQYMLEHHARR